MRLVEDIRYERLSRSDPEWTGGISTRTAPRPRGFNARRGPLAAHGAHQSYCLAGLAHGAGRGPLGEPTPTWDDRGVDGRRLGRPLRHGPGEYRLWADDEGGPGHARDRAHGLAGVLRRRTGSHAPVPG